MVKETFRNMLIDYAESENFEIEFQYDQELGYIFKKHFKFTAGPFSNLMFAHSINIYDDEKTFGFVRMYVYIDDVLNKNVLSEINTFFSDNHGLNVEYFDTWKCIAVYYRTNISNDSTDMIKEAGTDELFIKKMYTYVRTVLQTYVTVIEKGIDVMSAYTEAAESVDYLSFSFSDDVEFFYDYIKDADLNNERRKFVERNIIMKQFFNNPEWIIKLCRESGEKNFKDYVFDIYDLCDFHGVNEFDKLYLDLDINVKSKKKYVRIIIPDARCSGDITDFFIAEHIGKEPLLFTVEYRYDAVNGKKAYLTCIRCKEDTCIVVGSFKKYKKAVKFLKEKIKAA